MKINDSKENDNKDDYREKNDNKDSNEKMIKKIIIANNKINLKKY